MKCLDVRQAWREKLARAQHYYLVHLCLCCLRFGPWLSLARGEACGPAQFGATAQNGGYEPVDFALSKEVDSCKEQL